MCEIRAGEVRERVPFMELVWVLNMLAMMDWWPSWLFSPFLIYLLGKTWKTKDKYSKHPLTHLLSYSVVSSIPGSVLCSRHRVDSTEFYSSVSIFRHLPKIKTEKGMELHMLGGWGVEGVSGGWGRKGQLWINYLENCYAYYRIRNIFTYIS